MNIGIIVHSQTGNTLSVALKLQEALCAKGHAASLERVTPLDEKPSVAGAVRLKTAPDPRGYDALIFAAPVWAFTLSSVMKAYLASLPSLDGKKAGCFVTQQSPAPWMGGNRAVRAMKRLCRSKGIEVFDTGIVGWQHREREKQIDDLVLRLSAL